MYVINYPIHSTLICTSQQSAQKVVWPDSVERTESEICVSVREAERAAKEFAQSAN